MRIREYLKQTLLTSAIAASPVTIFATDGQPLPSTPTLQLHAADSRAVLRQVPETTAGTNTVQQVLYEEGDGDGKTSTVGAELERVFRENGQTVPVTQSSAHPGSLSPKIRLVQHAESNRNDGEAGQNSAGAVKKPGFIRRWFGKLSGGKSDKSNDGGSPQQSETSDSLDNPYLNSGQPAQKLPAPPPIDYGMRGGSANGSIPARPTGYQQPQGQSQATPVFPQQQGGVQPLIQNSGGQQGYHQPSVNQPGVGGYQPSPKPARQIPRDDGFIDPFDGQGLTQQEETILDLDSLIAGPEPVKIGAQNQLSPNYSDAEELLPELSVEAEIISQAPAPASDNGPFTGYRLDTDRQVQNQPAVKPVVTIQPVQKLEQHVPTQAAESILPVVEDTLDLTVPLIEEEVVAAPENELPPAEMKVESARKSQTAFEEIPLLEETDDESEQWESTTNSAAATEPEEESETFNTVPEVKPEFRTAETTLSEPDADRIRVLDSRARQEQQRYRIMARTGETGFKGFCPVTLRDQRELTDSREQYKAKFGLQTYYFASPEAKSAFEANPSRYAPAAGGSDVVLLVNTGEDTPGALDFSLWYRDRLYMFRSRETQAIFSKNPVHYADQY